MVVTNSPLKYCSRTTKAKGGWTEYNSNEASLKFNHFPGIAKIFIRRSTTETTSARSNEEI